MTPTVPQSFEIKDKAKSGHGLLVAIDIGKEYQQLAHNK